MKKMLLIIVPVIFMVSSMAQTARMANPRIIRAVPAFTTDIPVINPQQITNPVVNSKAILEVDLGQTRYDLQTNYSIQNRIVTFPDGTSAGVWTKGDVETAFPERGTGYNYFNGTAWGTQPTGRIETVRTGWPSIDAWNGTGEIIISHQSAVLPIVMSTRPVKGTGSWTQTFLPVPAGCSGIFWPRMITNGPNNNYIHIITCSGPAANGGAPYLGLDPALLYYRSLDGGATWDKPGIQLPGLDSSSYSAFSADIYAWGKPKGDTIYFAVGGQYTDAFIMKSTDNGGTWTKIPVLGNANKKIPATTTYLAPWKSADGSVACEMDHDGIIHFSCGIGGGYVDGGSKYILINYNGLIYWNTTMPMLKDSLDLDTLEAHGQLLGYYSDGPNPGDTLNIVTGYRVALTSFPQISIDDYNNMYVLYSGVTWKNPDPSGVNYRHIFGRARFHDKSTWSSEPIDLHDNIIYYGQEFIFASMAKRIMNDKLRVMYQTSDQPGTAVGTAGTSLPIPYHDNLIQFREIPGNTFWPTGVVNNQVPARNFVSRNYPNPVNGATSFKVQLEYAATLIVELSDLMGRKVMSLDKGLVNAGSKQFTIDCSSLTSGIYFFTVRINGETFTHKMIVE